MMPKNQPAFEDDIDVPDYVSSLEVIFGDEDAGSKSVRTLRHIHIPYFAAGHHARATLARASGEGMFDFLSPVYDWIHGRIAGCEECGRRYQEAYQNLTAFPDPDERISTEE